jgi:hypothetical protein
MPPPPTFSRLARNRRRLEQWTGATAGSLCTTARAYSSSSRSPRPRGRRAPLLLHQEDVVGGLLPLLHAHAIYRGTKPPVVVGIRFVASGAASKPASRREEASLAYAPRLLRRVVDRWTSDRRTGGRTAGLDVATSPSLSRGPCLRRRRPAEEGGRPSALGGESKESRRVRREVGCRWTAEELRWRRDAAMGREARCAWEAGMPPDMWAFS